MKKILMLSLLSLSAVATFAQSNSKKPPYATLNRQAVSFFMSHQGPATAAKSTTVKERVKAESDFDNTVTPAAMQDSALFIYSNANAANFDQNFMAFNYNNPYPSGAVLFGFQGHGVPTQQVMFDTAYIWTADPNTGIFGFYETASQNINVSGAITSFNDRYADSSNNQNTDQAIIYDGTGKIVSMYYFNSNLGKRDSTYKRFLSYDGSGNLMIDSTYLYNGSSWDLNQKTVYTRDASANILRLDDYTYTGTSTGWSTQDQYFCTYDASNRLATIKVTYNIPTFGGLVTVAKDTFSYTGSYPFYTSWVDHEATTDTVLNPYRYETKHVNTSGLPDTVYMKQWVTSSWVPVQKNAYLYNSYNDPIKTWNFSYTSGAYSTTPSFTGYWYYENYFPAGVTEVANKTDNARLYPNPTTGQITITGLEVSQNEVVNINIINITGQVLSKESLHWNGQSQQLNIGSLAPGTYWVLINDANGSMLHKQAIVKQ